MKSVPKPWIPVRTRESDGRIETEIFGRKNVSGKRSFLEEMTSNGESLLSAPIRVVGTEDGRDFVFENYTSLLMDEVNECYSDIVSSAESEQFVLNVTMKTEFDGFIDTSLTIVPRGRSVAQIFGLENLKP